MIFSENLFEILFDEFLILVGLNLNNLINILIRLSNSRCKLSINFFHEIITSKSAIWFHKHTFTNTDGINISKGRLVLVILLVLSSPWSSTSVFINIYTFLYSRNILLMITCQVIWTITRSIFVIYNFSDVDWTSYTLNTLLNCLWFYDRSHSPTFSTFFFCACIRYLYLCFNIDDI